MECPFCSGDFAIHKAGQCPCCADSPDPKPAHPREESLHSSELVAMLARWRERDAADTELLSNPELTIEGRAMIAARQMERDDLIADLESVVGRACLATDPELSDRGARRDGCEGGTKI